MHVDRYHRQSILPQFGVAGQQRLAASRVLLVGCGALGTTIAEQLARAGVGSLRIVDRDIVELTNLQRQTLFDEADARDGTPKAIAAMKRLLAVNSSIAIDPRVNDVDSSNVESFARDGGVVDLIVDGTDNAETRYLLNDVAVKLNIPWVYGACVGVEGRAMAIVPGRSACLRCLFERPPGAGELPTCDTAGVLAPVASIVASLQVIESMKLLIGEFEPKLIRVNGWDSTFRSTSTVNVRRDDCIACGKRQFEFLDSTESVAVRLCGRNAVQIRGVAGEGFLDRIAPRLAPNGKLQRTAYLVRFTSAEEPDVQLTLFSDGRALIEGTTDLIRARSLYARYIGM